jgi:hypothetical protein
MILTSTPKDLVGHPDGTNMVVKVLSGESPVCTVPASFLLDDLTVFEPKRPKPFQPINPEGGRSPSPNVAPSVTRNVTTWIKDNKRKFELLIRKHVTESFKHHKGGNLSGVNAAIFFGEPGSRVNVGLAMIRGNPILHVSPVTVHG